MSRPEGLVAILISCLALAAFGCSDDGSDGSDSADTGTTTADTGRALDTDNTADDTSDSDGLEQDSGTTDVGDDDVGNEDEVAVVDLWESPQLDYPDSGVTVAFDLSAAAEGAFFAFPYPSDLRRNEAGGADLTGFPMPTRNSLISNIIDYAQEDVPAFSQLSAVYFRFDGPIEVDTLPQTPEDSYGPEATAFIVDVTPESPFYGRRHPVSWHWRATEGEYWDANTLVLQAEFGFPLRDNTTYAAVVTTGVTDEDGLPVIGPAAFEALFQPNPPQEADALIAHYQPLTDTLPLLGMAWNELASATVFTTSGHASDLHRLRNWMLDNVDAPEVSDIFLARDGYDYDRYEGHISSEEFFEGTAPYTQFGEAAIVIDPETGAPSARTEMALRFAISIPTGPMPENGWPILIYGHGTGGSYRSFAGTTAWEMARRGIAVIGIDGPLHGERNPTNTDALDLYVQLVLTNIMAGKEMLRQGALDFVQMTRLMRTTGLIIPAEASATGEEIRTDISRVGFMGHSQGAQVAALLLAIEPDLDVGVLSEGAGGSAISLLLRKENDVDIEAVVSTLLGVNMESEPLISSHPVVGIIIQPALDDADPLSFGRHVYLEPFDEAGPDVLMTMGFQDAQTPPLGISALASTMGLPIAEPVYREEVGMSLQGIGSVALPVMANMPEVGERRGTGALIQFPGRNHFLVSRDIGAQFQVYEFIGSSLNDGAAWLYPATDR